MAREDRAITNCLSPEKDGGKCMELNEPVLGWRSVPLELAQALHPVPMEFSFHKDLHLEQSAEDMCCLISLLLMFSVEWINHVLGVQFAGDFCFF